MKEALRRLVVLAVLVIAMAVCPRGAEGGVPDPSNGTVGNSGGGGSGGTGSPRYPFVDLNGDLIHFPWDVVPNPAYTVVRVMDVGNFPVANQVVSIWFEPDYRIYQGTIHPHEPDPQLDTYCPCVETTTNEYGWARFYVGGAGRNTNGVSAPTGAGGAALYLGNCGTGMPWALLNVTTYDENGALAKKGVDITDLSAWIADYNNQRDKGIYVPRSDFDHDYAVDIIDLAWWVRIWVYFHGTPTDGTFCP